MSTALPISAFIIARDEADRIGLAIDSLRGLADEIVVVDSGSGDDTVKVAESHGARVVYHAWPGYGPQKRFGEEQCKNRWLLNLDADEALSPELAEEIRTLFAAGSLPHAGYRLRVCHMLPGETQVPRHTQVNAVVRLYDRQRARFSDSPVHDSVIISEGEVGALRGPVYHRSYRSLAHAIDKMNRYSTAQAEDMLRRGLTVSAPRIYLEFFGNFIKAYFFRRYIFRGVRGFNYAMFYAFFRLMKLAKWHEYSSPHRGEAGRGASSENRTDASQASPHPNPPPTGEGII